MLAVQTLEEDGEAVRLDLADGHTQGLYPRWGNWQKGVCAHGSDSMPPIDCYSARGFVVSLEAKGAVGVAVCSASISCQMQMICLSVCRVRCSKGRARNTEIAYMDACGLQRSKLGRVLDRRSCLRGDRECGRQAKTMQRSCQVQWSDPCRWQPCPDTARSPRVYCRDIFRIW